MPDISVSTKRHQAVNLFNLIHLMVGEGRYKAARQQVQKAILEVWPEASEASAQAPTDVNEERPLPLTMKQQRALAEGFLAFANDPKSSGQDLTNAMAVAEVCRVSGWVEKHLAAQVVPDFDEPLDAEPELLDPVKAPPATAAEPPLGGRTAEEHDQYLADMASLHGASAPE